MALRPPPTTYEPTEDARILPKPPKFTLFRRARKASRTLSIGTSSPPNVSLAALPLAGPDPLIDINPHSISSPLDDDQDQYRWAVVYENQRGLKIFSSLYYSFSSLLPTDPSPFTVPSSKRSKQPDVSLAVYPLPDGAWRWLSPWMIDMRSDSGEVQHDGFEYNFMFRTHKWHPEAGAMSWVRRRRWIRLMMRPAKSKDQKRLTNTSDANTPVTPTASILAPAGARNRFSVASSVPPSSFAEEDSLDEWNADEVWLSDDSNVNWEQCHIAIRRAGRDGRILELWRRWLGDTPPEPQDRMGKRKQWTEDDDPPPGLEVPAECPVPDPYTPPPIANIVPALRTHGDAILQSFIYPESRARFLQMLERAGILGELNSELGSIKSASEVDFWSYLNKGVEGRIIAEDSMMERK